MQPLILREIGRSKGLRLSSSGDAVVLEEGQIVEKGKTRGEEHWVIVGYYSSISGALRAALTKLTLTSDVDMFTALSSALACVQEAVEGIENSLTIRL